MEVKQSVKVARPPEEVWEFLSDVPAVAECVPGLQLHEERDDGTYRGSFAVKVGPLSAKLDGEGVLTRDDAGLSASVEGKGVDKRGGSRARGVMRYKVAGDGEGSVIDVSAEFTLSGPLAQIGRTSIIDDVAQTLTSQFAQNLEQRLAAAPGGAKAESGGKAGADSAKDAQAETRPGTEQFDAGKALKSAVWGRVVKNVKR